ncbi:unnamed protein product [Phytophthora lilii]|uniref:Unnamed protein product n=1 Tax=Phytophthora lilii TaxID=2077276 RepID=A0A9W6TTC5_9STRA|nr:unnamed protein product [Phytophthora lilii]
MLQDNKKTPLHFLCENEAVSADALEAILKAKPDVNAVDEFQSTPAHYICQNSRVSQLMIRELLKHKANFNIKNNVCGDQDVKYILTETLTHFVCSEQIGNTPIHYLCENDAVTVNMLEEIMSDKHVNVTISNSVRFSFRDYIPSRKQDCLAFLQKFAAPNLVPTGGASSATAEIGGEDPSELPEPLNKALTAWNASLPPFDAAFYNAVSCEAAFESTYDEVQEVSVRAGEALGDAATFAAWEKSLKKWRSCILLAYSALVPPNIWHQYAEQFQRPVPSDLSKVLGKVEAAWKQFPEQTQRRGRFEALAGVFNS